MLFGCPISWVGQMVPAWEMPIWRVHYQREPWGFRGLDMLASKNALQIAASGGRLKPGVTHADFMFKDKFESMDLSEAEYQLLSKEEKDMYLNRKIEALKTVIG